MSDNRILYVEEAIIGAVKRLLIGRVNELLGDMESDIPLIEFSNYRGRSVVVPVVCLSTCERSEKERIVKLDAYTLSIFRALNIEKTQPFYFTFVNQFWNWQFF